MASLVLWEVIFGVDFRFFFKWDDSCGDSVTGVEKCGLLQQTSGIAIQISR
jgi:hypothetical protein